MMKLGTVIPYLKKIQKTYESRDTPREFCWHQHFFTVSQQILLYRETQIYTGFSNIISNSFNFCWVFKDCFNKHGYNFGDVNKMATPGLRKIKVFWKKGYEVIIFGNNVNNKTLSRDSNYIVNVVMWPNFGNSSIFMGEAVITSSL